MGRKKISMPSTFYVPILPTKRGELSALRDLAADVRDRLTPLFVVHPVDWNFETDAPNKSVEAHITGLGKKIADAWGTSRAFIDPVFVIDETEPTGGLHAIADQAAAEGLRLVPVVSLGRPGEYLDAAAALVQRDGTGVCIRLSAASWPTTPGKIRELNELLATLAVTPEQVDLVLDLADEIGSELARTLAQTTLLTLPHAQLWRSVTIAGGSFPPDLSKVQKDRLERIPRQEWRLYCDIAAEAEASGLRVPGFGDYAVAHPDPTMTINPRFMNISGSLRYTIDGDWLVAKGPLFKGTRGGFGAEAVVPPARLIAGAEQFCGSEFSAGDAWIADVAATGENGGNPERWRRSATNHHLVFVTESLATRSAS